MPAKNVRRLAILGALVLTCIVLWVDIATGLWQEYVILAGLAAGLVTFALTTLVIDRLIARSAAARWKPVTRLALSDILHAIADEERSDVARDRIFPRLLEPLDVLGAEQLEHLRNDVLAERRRLGGAVASWSVFLSQSTDAVGVLDHAARLAEMLGRIRDASIEAEELPGGSPAGLNAEVEVYNGAAVALIEELRRAIAAAH